MFGSAFFGPSRCGSAASSLGASTIATTVFKSGERHNVVPDRAEALFDARLSPLHSGDDACVFLRGRMPHAELSVKSARLRPFETAADHPLVRTALEIAGRERRATKVA